MSLGLSAPAAVPVELWAADRRVYRLSEEIGMGGIRLRRAAPFEPGRPIDLRFALPGGNATLQLSAEVVKVGDPSEDHDGGGAALYFLDPTPEIKSAISAYIADRLGIPKLP